MAELRWNPLLASYTMVAANRQGRPHLPKDYCPFCPGSGKVPDHYEVLLYPNDFPALTTDAETPSEMVDGVYHNAAAHGKCDVVLYSDDHVKGLAQLPTAITLKLLKLWRDRYVELAKDPKIKYIFPFESRGEEVGVTIHHPHGQIYSYSWVPQKLVLQLDNCKAYYQQYGVPLFTAMNREELKDGRRVICQNDSFVAYLPYFTDYPYGVFIVTKKQRPSLASMSESELNELAEILRKIIGAFDNLFDRPFPYMMCVQQCPVNAPEYEGAEEYFHFHIEFYTPLRSKDKIKWLASSETGAGAAANTMLVEDTAVELRDALERFRNLEI